MGATIKMLPSRAHLKDATQVAHHPHQRYPKDHVHSAAVVDAEVSALGKVQ